ncbi:hypothetical protein VNO78_21859 [Psophocarpus tetragonolobus]|uniref:Uncharacterized protein n=1 Tax=Psophocarpus tetragonolobus TaxID=3891 RepID=A0AAN9XHY6_PSOTE
MEANQVLITSNNWKFPSLINIRNRIILTHDQPSIAINIIKPNLTTSPSNAIPDPTAKIKLFKGNNLGEKVIIRNPSSPQGIIKKGITTATAEPFTSWFGLDEPQKNANILVELEWQGIMNMFVHSDDTIIVATNMKIGPHACGLKRKQTRPTAPRIAMLNSRKWQNIGSRFHILQDDQDYPILLEGNYGPAP